MFKTLIATLFTIAASASHTFAAQWTSTYITHNNQLLNQERGTYVMFVYQASKWQSMGVSQIESYKTKYYNTLILSEIVLDTFKSSNTISATIMNSISNEFQLYRSTGVKCILRFVYTVTQGSSAPWGDASSPAIVLKHIAQLTPMLQANQDVIAYAQTGFVGIWGEWYYTDAFGDNGRISAQNMADRKAVHEALLAAVPQRTVQVRTPLFMQSFYGNAPSTGMGSSNYQRTGTHNDCFLADSSDQGTYSSYKTQYPYLSTQTQYTGAIFETCAVSSRSVCSTALNEIAGLHMVSGHRDYNTDVWNQWISGGCYNQILMTMGHRLSLTSSTSDLSTAIGSSFTTSVTIKNSGVSVPVNARRTEIVMRKVDDGSVCVATLNVDSRSMTAGSSFTLNPKIRLPSNIAAGRWELLLQFADPYSTLYGVPWYKIQAANNVIYESGTGMHKLNAIIDVVSGNVNSVSSDEVKAVCGLQLRDIVNATITSADSSCMGGYYISGSVCTMCPAGFACASATSSPVACGSNTWSAGGQRTCTACTSCSGKGTCQAKTGACLCNSGSSGFDCSVASMTPITLPPVTTPTLLPTSTPNTVLPPASGSVIPVSTTGCTKAINLLSNAAMQATGTTITGWTAGGNGYAVATGLQGQPSAQLYIAAGSSDSKSISQLITFSTPTSSVISYGAYVSSYLISGAADNNYALSLTVTYIDGTSAVSSLKAPVPSSVWVWLGGSVTPKQPVASVLLSFGLTGHTGNSYITQPVLALAPYCSVNGGPVGVTGSIVLADDGGDTTLGLSQSVWIGIYAAAGAVVVLVLVAVGVFCWRKKKQEVAVENAVAAQLTSV